MRGPIYVARLGGGPKRLRGCGIHVAKHFTFERGRFPIIILGSRYDGWAVILRFKWPWGRRGALD